MIDFMTKEARAKIRAGLRRLGEVASFLSFSRGLQEWGITLECLTFYGPAPHQLGIVANGVGRSFSSYGLENEVAHWLRRWDGVAYGTPLTHRQQDFLAARHQWLKYSGHRRDLPKERWVAFAEFVHRLGLNAWPEVMGACFGIEQEFKIWTLEAALLLGVEESDVRAVLGPADNR